MPLVNYSLAKAESFYPLSVGLANGNYIPCLQFEQQVLVCYFIHAVGFSQRIKYEMTSRL